MKKLILLLICLAFTMGSLPFPAAGDHGGLALRKAQKAAEVEQKKLDAKFKAAASVSPESAKVRAEQDTLNNPRLWEPMP